MQSDELVKRTVAYHESGHAVVQHALGWNVLFVGIGRVLGGREPWKGGSGGLDNYSPEGAVIAYAGPIVPRAR